MPETLRREANPPSGQLAAPLPQAWDAALKDFRKLTGELVQDSADPDARRFAMDVIPWSKTTGGVWVPGQVNAQLTGRNAAPVVRAVTETPLGAGATFEESTYQDLTAAWPGFVGLSVFADTVTRVQLRRSDGQSSDYFNWLDVALLPNRLNFIVPIFIPGEQYRWRVTNPTATAQTVLRVRELRYPFGDGLYPQNLAAVMAHQFQIRDTAVHNPTSDPQSMWEVVRTILGGGKVPIYVRNLLDQAVDVTVKIGIRGYQFGTLGTKSVAAGAYATITNQDFPGLDVPSEQVFIELKCAVAPTSGHVTASTDLLIRGTG